MIFAKRVVIDTSTLVGALLRPQSVPRQAFLRAVGSATVCFSPATLAELEDVLLRDKFDRYLDRESRQNFLHLYRSVARLFPISVDEPGSRYFCERFLGASQLQKSAKITRPLLPSAALIRPRRLVSTQQGVETLAPNDLTAFRDALQIVYANASTIRPALCLSWTKNLRFTNVPLPRFSAEETLTPSCRDVRDNKFLALALHYSAQVVISSDDDLLVLNPWQNIPILSPAQFLQ